MQSSYNGRMKTTPVAVAKTRRNHDIRVMTSLPAGRMTPVAAIPLLREDALTSCRVRLSFESMETAEILMNAINVRVRAFLVPNLAFERFSGMDELNRSYAGIPNQEGGAVTPYFATHVHADGNDIFKYLGKHAKVGDTVNSVYVEAYNTLWNFLAENRSKGLTKRALTEKTLAPAFWDHVQFRDIVPDFDQAAIDGAVPIITDKARAPVSGIYAINTSSVPGVYADHRDTTGKVWPSAAPGNGMWGTGAVLIEKQQVAGKYIPAIYAELAGAGLTFSLATIELAKKTQAFAKLRQSYSGYDDEYLIDMLMSGLTIPEQGWRQPQLIAENSTIFGMAKRYASDGGNLTESVVNGATFLDLVMRTPTVPCGGVVMVTVEILPEQLFERQADPYLFTTQPAQLPDYMRDFLDPEKVEIVTNRQIDVQHASPNGTFGYGPLNWKWNNIPPAIGGKFLRPVSDAFSEDRQRTWNVEVANPVLGEDFYISKVIHTKPFVVTNQDPFEVVGRGAAIITGNTVFGGMLVEADGDYEAVAAKAPTEKIVKS